MYDQKQPLEVAIEVIKLLHQKHFDTLPIETPDDWGLDDEGTCSGELLIEKLGSSLLVQEERFYLIRSFYFGWVKYSGHSFRQRGENSCPPSSTDKIPWQAKDIDGKLAPEDEREAEGIAKIHHKNGWTAISFWDRSGDDRHGSNTTFIAEGIFSFDEMIAIAKDGFSNIWDRFKFEVKPA